MSPATLSPHVRETSPIQAHGFGLLRTVQQAMLAGFVLGVMVLSKAADPSFSVVASVHDPAVVREGDTYYVFGSHLASAKSTDLMNWTQLTTSVAVGNALMPNPYVDYSEAFTWAKTTTMWAPDVIKLADGNFYHYYCACEGTSSRSALGLARSSTIAANYLNQGIMLKSGMWGLASPDGKVYDNAIHPNVVDPSIFYDTAGTLWMVYGSYSGGIFIMELDSTTGWIKPNQGYGTKLIGGNNVTIEGPTIIYSPETGYYYLFVTYGGLAADGGYNIRMGRATSPKGPYLDYEGNDLSTVKGPAGTYFNNDSIAPYGVKLMGNCRFVHVDGDVGTLSRGYVSPGGSSIYRDPQNGRYVLVIHSRFVGTGEYHEVRSFQLHLNEEGWFVIAPQRYAGEAMATATAANLSGSYKLINHGKDVTATVKLSTLIKLNTDGGITGDSTGTWSLSGDHYANLTIDGVSYKGVFAQNWDDDNKVWVGTFSALSGKGVAVWGSKVSATTTDTAPTITTQPVSQSVAGNKSVSFTVAASGSPEPGYQWKKNGVNISGATSATYTISKVASADAGNYVCVVGNRLTAIYSAAAVLTVTTPAGPELSVQPTSKTVAAGGSTMLSVVAAVEGVAYQWRKYDADGNVAEISGATSSSLSFSELSSEDEATYDCVVTKDGGSTVSSQVRITVTVTLASNPGGRLTNLSARAHVKTGIQSTIVGFVVGGSGTETILVRGSGPALRGVVTPVLEDPKMSLYAMVDTSKPVMSNDDWCTNGETVMRTLFKQIGAFEWTSNSLDAALSASVAGGGYSAVVDGKNGTGIGLIEMYEVASTGTTLRNLSTRGVMAQGDDSLIAGFVISGTGMKTMLIRAAGPDLKQYFEGYTPDPVLKLYNQQNISWPVMKSDDWDSDTSKGDQIVAVAKSLGASAWTRGSKDAAILVTLKPGVYSVVGSSKDTAGGVGLIEVFEANP